MGRPFDLSTAGRPSMGSPVTLNRRPWIASPTGIAIALPVSVTSTPNPNLGTIPGDATNAVFSEVLLHFKNQLFTIALLQFQCIIDFGQFANELNVYNGADN